MAAKFDDESELRQLIAVEDRVLPKLNYLKYHSRLFTSFESECTSVVLFAADGDARRVYGSDNPEYKRNCEKGVECVYIFVGNRKEEDLDMRYSETGKDPFVDAGTGERGRFRVTRINGKKLQDHECHYLELVGDVDVQPDRIVEDGPKSGATGFKRLPVSSEFVARSERAGKYGFTGVAVATVKYIPGENNNTGDDIIVPEL